MEIIAQKPQDCRRVPRLGCIAETAQLSHALLKWLALACKNDLTINLLILTRD